MQIRCKQTFVLFEKSAQKNIFKTVCKIRSFYETASKSFSFKNHRRLEFSDH